MTNRTIDSSRSPYFDRPEIVAQAYVDGQFAARDPAVSQNHCPFPVGSHEHGAWCRGHTYERFVNPSALQGSPALGQAHSNEEYAHD